MSAAFQAQVEIPFLPDWELAMLTGRKTATTRRRMYAAPGVEFSAFGAVFRIMGVHRLTLQEVADRWYLREGCAAPLDFIEVWNALHPRAGWNPRQVVYLHEFARIR